MSKTGKLITAIVLSILMLFTMGMVLVKDSRQDPGYCRGCHSEPYYTTWAGGNSYSLAHQHFNMGISCQTCHDRTVGESLVEVFNYATGNYYMPLPESDLPMQVCLACHGSYAKIIPLTTPERLGSERNPHAGHWGELECNGCHKMHRDSIDYCAECHNPVTHAPGWTK